MFQVLLAVLFSWSVFADVIEAPVNPVDYMQNPAQINWKKIDTEHFEIIFPREVESDAQRVAHLLEKVYPYVGRSLETLPPKISIVLQNQSTISNGIVTLAPRRSEWYLTPSIDPDLGSTEWLQTLAVHEFRHVVQFQKSKRGFNKFWYFILGEVGQAVGLGLTMPPWFLEGDAVGMETALTRGGRGRIPRFERDLRTLLLSGKKFDYDKAHLGSYKDYIPNHYIWGYFYTTFLRNKYGDLFLSKVTNYSTDMGWNPLSFYRGVDDLTGEKFEDFYEKTMQELIAGWQSKLDQLKPTPYEVKSLSRSMGWTNYSYPQVQEDKSVVALKSGQSDIPHFVRIKDFSEKRLFTPAWLVTEYPYKVRKNKLAFVEYELDPRWGYRDYARLKVYDLKSDSFVTDIRKTKYRLAVIDHQGERILAVKWSTKQNQFVVIIGLDGTVKQKIEIPKEKVITSLDWLTASEIVLVIKDIDSKKSIVRLSLKDQTQEVLVGPSDVNIGFVASENGQILYESPESGIDNIFLYQKSGAKQITSAKFGSYAPDLKSGELYYNDYTAEGMNVVKKSLIWDEEQKSSDSFIPFYEKFAQTENVAELEGELLKKEKYKSQEYSQIRHAPNVHSWLIFAAPLSPFVIAQFYSRDILNKFSLSGGFEYNLNERTTTGFVSAAWSHLYTVFDIRGAYGTRRQDVKIGGRKIDNKWEEGTFDAGISVPWKSLVGRFTQTFTARAFSSLIKVTNKISRNRAKLNDGALFSPGAEIRYAFLSRLAQRDINPDWGYSLFGRMEEGQDVTGVKQSGSLTSVDNRLFLPGLLKHHSFFHQFAYERQRDDFYQYTSYIFYPRGTDNVFLQEFTKYSGNYTFPMASPDVHWSRYLYLKRVYANLFYDELNGRYRSFSYNASSYGWEVLFETHIARIFLPITIGLRGNYKIKGDGDRQSYELFLGQVLGVF